jgi:murein DD-endopeptidase MepM/ murein hydrolase activator NlpD
MLDCVVGRVGGLEPMSEGVTGIFRRNAVRFALTGIVGIWLSGCADATRFADSPNPFSNPFSTASNDSAAPTPRTSRISSRPLAQAKSYNRNYATDARPSPVAVAAAPAPSLRSTGSIRSAAQPVGGSAAGWSAVGGSPIIVSQADDAATLSQRYGVPEAALLSANGLHSRSDIRPNMRIVIPVFNARSGGARVASADDGRGLHEREARDRDTRDRDASDREAHDKARHADRRAAADEDTDSDRRKSDRADADRADHKKHKADAKRGDDDAKADDSRPSKKMAKAERLKHDEKLAKDEKKHAKDEKLAKAEKVEKREKVEKSEKRGKETAKESAKAERSAKAETQVAKAEPAKLARKAETDKEPTGNVAAASSSSSTEAGAFRWPARGRIIQGFKIGGNDGINIALPEGTSVRAAEDGKVAYAGSALKGYGNLVLIRHPNGFVSAYANNGELDVKSGDVVKRGQVIAKSGQTGDVSSPQLHFELRKGQKPVDPTNYLAGL